MIPFENTWPYEQIQEDIYVQECPFCSKSNVLLPFKRKDLSEISQGVKRLLVFPCCHNKVTVVEADRDYLLANQPLRNRR
ncbi:hypothetical protein N0M98_25800 [Paenibacillus doosanensis]|uniref:Cytoplasmic protein n=1 Tax=Paenibacillus konkukensis TaxID=2020716 RepID=A0ABY4RN06_9BACL|nr:MULTISPECIES: hypothetical protein [Paenibacillus]MCS7463526.1 hypothetical protein [Paenibacillus doosanensis]UQZ83390.1 hypothetical protein SK3146_02577 [Paenibacillus konkukensis]